MHARLSKQNRTESIHGRNDPPPKKEQKQKQKTRKLIIPRHLLAQLPPSTATCSAVSWVGVSFVVELGVTWAEVAKGQIGTCVVNNAWPCKGFFFPPIKRPPRELPEWKCHKSWREVLISATPYMPVAPRNNNNSTHSTGNRYGTCITAST